MAVDATGTPTTLGIPRYDVTNDAPSGLGFNAAMQEIDDLLAGRIAKPATPVEGDALVYSGGEWVAQPPASQASVTPIQWLNPLDSNSFWTVTAQTAGAFGHWEFLKDVAGFVYGQVLVPAGVTDATVRIATAANATTGVTRLQLYAQAWADTETMFTSWNIGNPVSAQDIAVPGTALKRKDVTWSLSGLAGSELLLVSLNHDGAHANDTLAVNTLMYGAWLEPA